MIVRRQSFWATHTILWSFLCKYEHLNVTNRILTEIKYFFHWNYSGQVRTDDSQSSLHCIQVKDLDILFHL